MAGEPDIKVESYKDLAFAGSWSGRGRSLWSISTLGLVLGGGIGLVAPFIPVVAGVQTLGAAAALLPESLAIFGALGMTTGFAGSAFVGSASGAAATVAEEQERREKKRTIRLEKMMGLPAGALSSDPKSAEPDMPKSAGQRFSESLQSYVNPKIGLVFAALGAIGGLVLAASFIALGGLTGGAAGAAMPAMATLLGPAASSAPAVSAYGAGVMACFGALWSLNLPKIASEMTAFAGGLTSGKLLGTQWGPAPELEKALQKETPGELVLVNEAAPKMFALPDRAKPRVIQPQENYVKAVAPSEECGCGHER